MGEHVRRVSDLYFRFLRGTEYSESITVDRLCRLLVEARLIRLLPDRSNSPDRYIETEKMKRIEVRMRHETVKSLIENELKCSGEKTPTRT